MNKLIIYILSILAASCSSSKINSTKFSPKLDYTECSFLFSEPEVDSVEKLKFTNKEFYTSYYKNGLKVKTLPPAHRGKIKIDTSIYNSDLKLRKKYFVELDKRRDSTKIDSLVNKYQNGQKISSTYYLGGQVLRGEYETRNDTTFEKTYDNGFFYGSSFSYYDKLKNKIIKPRPGKECSSVITTYLNEYGNPYKEEWSELGTSNKVTSITKYQYDDYQRLVSKKNYKDEFEIPRSITVYKFDESCPFREELFIKNYID